LAPEVSAGALKPAFELYFTPTSWLDIFYAEPVNPLDADCHHLK
jgi:hypothetical protein